MQLLSIRWQVFLMRRLWRSHDTVQQMPACVSRLQCSSTPWHAVALIPALLSQLLDAVKRWFYALIATPPVSQWRR
jgi:hypothetical protein